MRDNTPLLEIRHLYQSFVTEEKLFKKARHIHALYDVNLHVNAGETLGIVGESGSGKSTLLRSIIRLYKVTQGEIFFNGREITRMSEKEFLPLRKDIQMIFQDPYASLDPRMTVRQIVSEPLVVFKKRKLLALDRHDIQERVLSLVNKVGLGQECLMRYPYEFSGGQRQRIGIARALALNPQLILADEPVSALDVSIQGQILNLMRDVQHEWGLAYIFVAHDLAVVRYMADRIAVMYLGHIVEIAPADDLYRHPMHPYTQALLSAVSPPAAGSSGQVIPNNEPIFENTDFTGCPFAPRCPFARKKCLKEKPALQKKENLHEIACFFSR